jgi:hypothetical protein
VANSALKRDARKNKQKYNCIDTPTPIGYDPPLPHSHGRGGSLKIKPKVATSTRWIACFNRADAQSGLRGRR